jgi:hypothetical protein
MAERIDAEQALEHMHAHPESLLVCAYDSDAMFHEHPLEGAISLSEFEAQADHLPHDREIIFYCA